jgi:hypothetical protein
MSDKKGGGWERREACRNSSDQVGRAPEAKLKYKRSCEPSRTPAAVALSTNHLASGTPTLTRRLYW